MQTSHATYELLFGNKIGIIQVFCDSVTWPYAWMKRDGMPIQKTHTGIKKTNNDTSVY
jgi:hypothetical protein